MDNLGVTMLMCARCAYAYHCKVPAQLPSPGGNVACPEDGVKASKTQDVHLVKLSSIPQTVRSGWHQVQEVYRKRSANVDGEKKHLRFRFPGPAGFRSQLRILLSNSGF